MNYGFIKVAAAIPTVEVAQCKYNVQQMETLIAQAEGLGVEIICFPELSITGYSCQDLFSHQILLDEAVNTLLHLLDFTRELNIIVLAGMPLLHEGVLYNCAVVLQQGKLLGFVPKTYLPNYKEFYEQRWFASGKHLAIDTTIRLCGQSVPLATNLLFETPNCTFAVEICEDVWAPIPPSSGMSLNGAELIFNLSADNDGIGKNKYLRSLISQQSARCIAGYVFASCGYGESTQDLVFSGRGLIYENGVLLANEEPHALNSQLVVSEIDVERLRMERRVNTTFFASKADHQVSVKRIETEPVLSERDFRLTRNVRPYPFIPDSVEYDACCREILSIPTEGLMKRIRHTRCKTVVVGISGGLDSTLALLVCVQAFDRLGLDRKGIVGITMPGFGTTNRTYTNATNLIKSLGITFREISIKESCIQHFKDIEYDYQTNHDITYENCQARERTQILMDVANQMQGLVVGTGDLSELALGWATYNGDHMSMYGVNASIPKTLIKHLVGWVAMQPGFEKERKTLQDIIETPISPELIPNDENGEIAQKTEDIVGPYELHDFFLFYFLRHGFRPAKIYFLAQKAFSGIYDDETIRKWLTTFFRRFFSQQFKRSCLPDGPKVGSCSLSPRGDWRMASDVAADVWLEECRSLDR